MSSGYKLAFSHFQARTGGREMALRNADYIILYYSAVAIDSLQALHPLVQPLQYRKNVSATQRNTASSSYTKRKLAITDYPKNNAN